MQDHIWYKSHGSVLVHTPNSHVCLGPWDSPFSSSSSHRTSFLQVRTHMMRQTSPLQLVFVFVLFFLVLHTACHPRPTARCPATADDLTQDSHHVGAPSNPDLITVERAAGTSLRRRMIGFQHFLEIGGGWNMYYSSWPSIALPVRKSNSGAVLPPIW